MDFLRPGPKIVGQFGGHFTVLAKLGRLQFRESVPERDAVRPDIVTCVRGSSFQTQIMVPLRKQLSQGTDLFENRFPLTGGQTVRFPPERGVAFPSSCPGLEIIERLIQYRETHGQGSAMNVREDHPEMGLHGSSPEISPSLALIGLLPVGGLETAGQQKSPAFRQGSRFCC